VTPDLQRSLMVFLSCHEMGTGDDFFIGDITTMAFVCLRLALPPWRVTAEK
jgi:hypothetical protein